MRVPISSLPQANALTGAELIPVVQDGQTKRTTTDAIPYVPAGTGAVATTVQAKLRETVSVEDFIPAGTDTANTDCATYIQAALDTGKDVVFTKNEYRISTSLKVGTQRLTGQGYAGSFRQTIIYPNGNFPAFIGKPGSFTSFSIDGFFINYGATAPTVSAGNSSKIGFYFTGATWPQFSEIKNCTVQGAWYGYYDDAGTYESVLYRVRTVNCRSGFYKASGTTIKFDTCGAGGGQQGFVILNCLAPTLINCSADQLAVTTSTPNAAGNYFYQCPALTVRGFDGESNTITGHMTSYMKFDLVVGSVSGFVGYQNTLTANGTDQVNLFYVLNNSRVQFDGCRVPGLTASDLIFSGTGYPFTLYADTSANATLVSSQFSAAINGTPATRYSVAGVNGTVLLINTFVDNTTTNTRVLGSDTNWIADQLLIGTSSTGTTVNGTKQFRDGTSIFAADASLTAHTYNKTSWTSGTTYICAYNVNNSLVGYISSNGSTTNYSTTSDYRLKENVTPMENGLLTIQKLNPVNYTWIKTGLSGNGFLAHELAEVAPDCVVGEKDAVDAEGNPIYQSIDTSFLVATLVSAIKQLKAEVDALKASLPL